MVRYRRGWVLPESLTRQEDVADRGRREVRVRRGQDPSPRRRDDGLHRRACAQHSSDSGQGIPLASGAAEIFVVRTKSGRPDLIQLFQIWRRNERHRRRGL